MDVMFHALAKAASLLFTGADDVGACRQSYLGTIWIPYSSTRDYGFVYTIGFRNLAGQDRLGRLLWPLEVVIYFVYILYFFLSLNYPLMIDR
ncbi:hypothetical protein IWW34DRAFT_57692 [Fusarium oxysporum f. sp. albedinis]|jgi:hypothetical protein|uniref:uncharacterized protein n=1 Tax=Fusarium oxysporum Fo47 TaxID=660027 RepID=UPI002869854F|nr:uncharacterized protein FOBCDRAFT_21635 [Fusarium oxysporum Fo47]KAI3577038.1 hypothetical protein IWW34DRAFT_57692 [Fusarium oxysporum f. sp. albedinis]KAK2481584.1 hypothetical protein H9L39_07223 [Fusarium oxysporum f. sp. albedinis]WJG34962.1 hypothetical protein FOBCDRAFT_21635 [Fusarium oxysporum Fo47]